MSAYREVVSTNYLSVLVKNIASRHTTTVLRVNDNLFGKTCCFVGLSLIGRSFDYVVESQSTSILGHDYGIEWVPLSNEVALSNSVAMLII